MHDQPSRSAQARRRLQIAAAKQTQKQSLPDASLITGQYFFGTFLANESAATDVNLAQVKIGAQTYRYVPRASGVAPGVGATVLLLKVGTQLLLLCQVVGDTSKAPHVSVAP